MWFEYLLLCEETNYGWKEWRDIYISIRESGIYPDYCQSWPQMWWMKLLWMSKWSVCCLCIPVLWHYPNSDKQLFLQIDDSFECSFGIMAYYLKDSYNWIPDTTILIYQIELVMFLNRCLTNYETNYNPLELEVACLVLYCKQLRTLLYSNRYRIVVFIDHDSIYGIVNRTSLDIVSIDRINRHFVNVSIYLTTYLLDIYHLSGRFNLIPDALSCLKTLEDTEIWQYDEESVLDVLWNEVLSIDTSISVFFLSEAQIMDKMCQ